MRVRWMAAIAWGLCMVSCAWAQSVESAAVQRLLKTLEAPSATESAVVYQDANGVVLFLGAPQGGAFRTDDAGKAAGAAASAKGLVEDHRAAFGLGDSTLAERKTQSYNGNSYVRFDQAIGGVKVFGADLVVQVNGAGNVVNVVNDVAHDLSAFGKGAASLTPSVPANIATAAARQFVDGLYDQVALGDLSVKDSAALNVFAPAVLGLNGPQRLVWVVEVVAESPEQVRQLVFVDAASGEVVFHFSNLHEDRNREILDYENGTAEPTEIIRAEDDPAVGQVDADTTFDYLGDTYDFYFDLFGRDSFDDQGATIVGKVRYPEFNASWNGEFITVGTLIGADDVIAHEMTHAVTEYTSNLIYQGFSGAINESMSDVFGEFIDQLNGAGDDRAGAKWWLGEDVLDPADTAELPLARVGENAFRYMKDPTVFGDPDRLSSPNLISPLSGFDRGGVHINSGINNKLCYLLTDGDTFNGKTTYGMGITTVATLYYGAQFLLSQSADYYELYFVLGAVASEMGLSVADRLNIKAGAQAVEIEPVGLANDLTGFRAIPTRRQTGEPVIALSWTNPAAEVLAEVTLVRNVSGFPSTPSDGVVLATGKPEKFLDDVELQEGVTYYYAVFADVVEGLPRAAYAKATAGGTAVAPAMEAFGLGAGPQGTTSVIDLAFSQLTFTPAGTATGAAGSNQLGVSYEGYDVTFTPGVFELPVPREDNEGGATSLNMVDDEIVTLSLGNSAVPFFGQWYSQVTVGSNGYLSFTPQDFSGFDLTPSLADALDLPRIAFLFTDLNPQINGEIWIKQREDKVVLTFSNVPQFRIDDPLVRGNTAQVELFYTGTIRITYGNLSLSPNFPMNAVCGLSDGNGPAYNPAELFPDEDLQGIDFDVDLSAYPRQPTRLTFAPLPQQRIEAGERIQFTAQTVIPSSLSGTPIVFADWNGSGAAPFSDNGNGTGTFDWQTKPADDGIYTVRVTAVLGGQRAYQDVRLIVAGTILYPTAANLSISTNTPFEDPTVSRFVADDRPLISGYTYISPAPGDPSYDEGTSYLVWMRNGQIVTSLLNQSQVPSNLTVPGDQWYFRVIPITESFIAGSPVASPVVTIAGYPNILRIAPSFGTIHGGDKVRITGERLRGVLSVSFGGVEAAGIRAISDTEIEVTTPVHLPGTVPVAIRSSTGTGTLANAFTFIGDGGDFPRADVNLDGRTNATDVQLVINAVLELSGVKGAYNGDVNRDGAVSASDIQSVVNSALYRK